jgi:hypothetical protein
MNNVYRTLMLVFFMAVILFGMHMGVSGMESIGKSIFGSPFGDTPLPVYSWQLLVILVFCLFGALVGMGGLFFLFILPLTFCFPNLCSPPTWQKTQPTPKVVKRFFLWYSTELKKYAEKEYKEPNK